MMQHRGHILELNGNGLNSQGQIVELAGSVSNSTGGILITNGKAYTNNYRNGLGYANNGGKGQYSLR